MVLHANAPLNSLIERRGLSVGTPHPTAITKRHTLVELKTKRQVLLGSGFQRPVLTVPGGMDAFSSPSQTSWTSWASVNGSDRHMPLVIHIAPYCPQHQLGACLSRNRCHLPHYRKRQSSDRCLKIESSASLTLPGRFWLTAAGSGHQSTESHKSQSATRTTTRVQVHTGSQSQPPRLPSLCEGPLKHTCISIHGTTSMPSLTQHPGPGPNPISCGSAQTHRCMPCGTSN